MIGVFDSGVGGLSLVGEMKKWLPECSIVYFGDTARCPWGNKSGSLVRKYADEIASFLIGQGIKDIVIACNTASTFASDYLQEKYPNVNFYDVIDPVIKKIRKELESVHDKESFSVGIIGTAGTIDSGIYRKKIREIDSRIKIYSQACPLLVPLVEEGMAKHKATKMMAEEYLKDMKKKKINILVLGCTHYPFIKDVIREVMGEEVQIVDSLEEIAKKIVRKRCFSDSQKKEDIFYFSDLSKSCQKSVKEILGDKAVLRKMIF